MFRDEGLTNEIAFCTMIALRKGILNFVKFISILKFANSFLVSLLQCGGISKIYFA